MPNDGTSSRDVTATDSHRFDNIRNICTFENTKPFINNNLNRQQIVISSEPISRQFSHKKTSHEFQLSIEFENENRHSKKDRDYDTHTHTRRVAARANDISVLTGRNGLTHFSPSIFYVRSRIPHQTVILTRHNTKSALIAALTISTMEMEKWRCFDELAFDV